ncbi:serine/arginine repetitive matrix protein 1 isoform X3 [Strongylocentrotus purpuratus]|uniref:Btz domain-containing protein n=1 Tax=Strongylocentrotus purpuratus TaxID=7668 RepID=A0A7M7HLU4_STRPU|nr:serine/arginine repetitive matrix protein 1 isoform X3 [Strongylocentrotus purpuratus]|eukprot:XP_011679845.1 PREDICTED: serine/arginine repetitive matrix protein 1 isoform X3 [Strongylocentrotus purpuratus]
MPQDGRYRRRSRSRSRSKRNRRRRHGSSKSSGSSYSRSRSRSPEKRYRNKDRSSRRTPPKYRRSSKQSPSHERKRQQRYDRQSRSESSSPRRRSLEKKEYLDTSKVLTGNFSNIPGLDYIGRGGKGAENESSQDLDLRLRELETHGSAGSSRSRAAEQPKNSQTDYYDSKRGSQESYKQRSRSPGEKKYESSRYSKERAMSPDNKRYRDQKDQKRPDYGIRVEVKRKPSPKRRKFDPSLVFIPRRKDEGLQQIFDRPEIIVRNLEDDPEMYPEKYERFACWRKSPERSQRKNDREYSREREEGPRKQNRHHKDGRRSPSPEPQQPRKATVMMKPFTVFEKYEQSLRNKPAQAPQEVDNYLQRPQEFSLSHSSLPLSGSLSGTTSMFTSSLGMNNVLDVDSDLRMDLDVRRQFLVREAEKQLDLQQLHSATSPTLGRLTGSVYSLDRREIASSDRRPVRERLGDLDRGGLKLESEVPDFRKEVEELQRLDPTAQPIRGNFYEHDDRDQRSLSEEKRGMRPPQRGRGGFVPRGSYRGGRGFIRGFRGRGFNRGFRGNYNNRGGFSGRGQNRGGYASAWKHDKFEGKDRDDHDKREKKDKKSKSSDKKRDSKK